MPAEGQPTNPDMITSVPGMEPREPGADVIQAGNNMPLDPESPQVGAFQVRAQRAADNGGVGPEYVMPEVHGSTFSAPTEKGAMDGPRITGAITRPDGVTIDSQIVGGAKETQIHGMGSQHNLPETAAEYAARMRDGKSAVQRETERQMGIAAADRSERARKGMPPPSADLR